MTALQSGIPTDILEQRAAEQRRELHNSVTELRDKLREKMDVRRQAQEHFWPAAGIAAFLGLALGYGITGIFTD